MEFPKAFTIWWYGIGVSHRENLDMERSYDYGTLDDHRPLDFMLFAAYSILGWCYEVVLDFVARQKLVNRGFLMGPLLPHLRRWRRAGAAAVWMTTSLNPCGPLF